jgi:hypothetical protein
VSGTLPRRFGLKDALHAGGLSGRRGGIHPIHDFLEGFRVGMDGRLIEQNVFGLFQSGGQHELRAVNAGKFRCSIDEFPILRAGAQMNIDLGCCRLLLHPPNMRKCVAVVNTRVIQNARTNLSR